MKRMYCISGLGADQRIFQKLVVDRVELVPVLWPHHKKDDTIKTYADKVSATIPGERPLILGVSFGGMLAVEMAKQRLVEKVFIVSSAKTVNELPKVDGLLKLLLMNDVIPASVFTMPNKILLKHFGAQTDEEKEMLRSILKDSDGHFMKWAMKRLLAWDNKTCPKNVVHIHGTADQIIPAVNVKPDYWIKDGTHIMIYNRAVEISKLIAENL